MEMYNVFMNVREEVKIMLGSKCMTITELAKKNDRVKRKKLLTELNIS